jgi:hypothetical protein
MAAVYVKEKDLEMKAFEGETIVLNPKEGDFFKLNEVGALILENLDGQQSTDDLVKKVVEAFEVEEAQAVKDVNDFIAQLKTLKLVKAK